MASTNFLPKMNISNKIQYNDILKLARKIMLILMQYRRIPGRNITCSTPVCEACLAPHLPQVVSAIHSQQPITMVLPAFPAKSPNPTKVLGILPDMAERLSLEFLNTLCKQIQAIYSPGARIILCSDGRVFNDVIGIPDSNVSVYQKAIALLIKELSLAFIATFNLDDLYSTINFNQMRHNLIEKYGEPLEAIENSVGKGSKMPCNKDDEEIHRQYCGITRFLVEDALHPEQKISRNELQKISRKKAYLVIQRSRAWSVLIAEHFPNAVRLSIHPQTCGMPKLGIRLIGAENWMTPWHGVAVNIGDRFILLKRKQAEALGAHLVYHRHIPSHYELTNNQQLKKLKERAYEH